MAYGWVAQYGYVLGTSSQQPNLEGMHFSDLTFTDIDKYFIIPESKTDPLPRVNSYVGIDTALLRRGSLTEYYYATFIPHAGKDRTVQAVADSFDNAVMAIDELFPNALRYPIRLLSRLRTLCTGNVWYKTFVALKGRHKVITNAGELYSFTDDDDTLHRVTVPGGTSYTANIAVNNASSSCTITLSGNFIPTDDNIASLNPNNLYYYNLTGNNVKSYNIFSTSGGSSVNGAQMFNFLGISTGDYDVRTDPDNPSTDPYNPAFPPAPGPGNPGNPSGPGGGGGSMVIPPSDPTPLPTGGDLPNPSALGLYHIYNPSTAEMITLGQELYQVQDSAVKEMSKLTNNAMEAILSVHCLPYQPASGGSVPIQIGHYTATASAAVVTSDHEIIDCGSVTIDEIWGSYLDYNMQIKLFLPFVGFIPLDPDDVVGKSVQVLYIVDNATGAFCAIVRRVDDEVVLGTFGGNCSYQIPLTSTNYSEIVNAITQLASTALAAGAGLASGGLAAPMVSGLASSALNVATAKKHYDTAGGLGTNTGFMGVRVPYLKIMVPNACVPTNQNKYKGYPAYMTKRLGDLSGYTEVDAIHLEMIPATPEELQAIKSRLTSGVIL